jgi:hypothetical protein
MTTTTLLIARAGMGQADPALSHKLRVGREGTMRDIIAAQFGADRVITL